MSARDARYRILVNGQRNRWLGKATTGGAVLPAISSYTNGRWRAGWCFQVAGKAAPASTHTRPLPCSRRAAQIAIRHTAARTTRHDDIARHPRRRRARDSVVLTFSHDHCNSWLRHLQLRRCPASWAHLFLQRLGSLPPVTYLQVWLQRAIFFLGALSDRFSSAIIVEFP